jgi:hypothetical protein
MSTHAPPQTVLPDAHAQTPLWHVCPGRVHAFPQPPQLLGSVCMSTHEPPQTTPVQEHAPWAHE